MEENDVIICSNCYEENEYGRKCCYNCGKLLYYNNLEKEEDKNEEELKEDDEELEEEENSKEYLVSYHTNKVAITIQTLSILNAIIGVVIGITIFEDFEVYAVGFIAVILISSLFTYAIGEIIQKLQNIEDNTRK